MFSQLLKNRWGMALAFVAAAGLASLWIFQESHAGEKSGKGWLGVIVKELTPSLREKMKLGNETGLLVSEVVRDSPADDAGLEEGDVIIQFDGKKVEQADDFSRAVRNAGADSKVNLIVLREGTRKTMEVMLGKRSRPGYASGFSHGFGQGFGHAPGKEVTVWMSRPRLGVQVHELDENLAAYFKVEPRSGVLVLEVNEDSPAAKAGLRSGDVITKVDNETVRDAEDLIESLQDYEEGDEVKIEYVRQGKRETTAITIEPSSDSNFRMFSPGRKHIRGPSGSNDWREAQLEAWPYDPDEMQNFDELIEDQVRAEIDHEINDNIHRELERELRLAPRLDRTL